jgi:Flp pilus assembly protein TadD
MIVTLLLSVVLTAGPAAAVKCAAADDGRCYTNSPRFLVPYRLEHAPPPSSLLKPALYYSADAGRTWKLGAIDVDATPPVTFTAPGDGEYWLRMGLQSPFGSDAAPPDFGRDPAGALVAVVDTRPPAVRLVPRLTRDERGPILALRVALGDEPLDPPDLLIEVDVAVEPGASPRRELWIDRAVPGREYDWLLDPQRPAPASFRVVAVDRAGNVGSDSLDAALLAREAREVAGVGRPTIVRLGALPASPSALTAAVEYTLDGPPLRDDERVELWTTEDQGQTWQVNSRQEDPTQPLVFTAPRPGLFGLRLAIRQGAGYVGEPPKAGTRPQTYVAMERAAADATVARLTAAAGVLAEVAAAANTPADLRPAVASATAPPAVPAPPAVAAPRKDPLPSSPDHAALAQAAYQRGNYARLQGRWDEASRHFREALAHQPEHVAALNDLAGACHQLGRYDEAIDAYQRALDLEPRNADVRFNLARALLSAQRFDQALAQLDEVLRVNPADGEAWLCRGELLARQGDRPAARAAWQKALDLAPPHAAWPALARRRLADQ